ncbi:branched-chain amino acid transport system II carrier protein [Desulfolucanica intricata]|uniref:branched-chain amino acid transport system II carrier protein n=1 Tax=Desulfolucanica intricata TaxID=1285191 RepID=UPI0008379868|nr:branched-chain amino acid transport system II carrier protein [Desulfolucanica intricata]
MQLSKKEIFVTGLALLAMFLGAGNLIFPPMLGFNAGTDLWWAAAGFIMTGVGLPLLGVTAVARAGGDLEYLANRVHPLFSKIVTTIVVLSIGPLLAIPRTAATTFEVAVTPFLQTAGQAAAQPALAVTTLVFFVATLLFALRPSEITDNLGKLLTPLMVIFLGILIFKGVTAPIGTMGAGQYAAPLARGFLEGYNTMDALASVIFGLVIVNAVKAKGVTNNSEIARVTILAGVIAAIGLSSIYTGLTYVGATTGATFTGDNPGQMLTYITEALIGPAGKFVIAVTMTLACLTTAIGLVSTCGAFFSRLSGNRVSYNVICVITALVSLVLANMGLSKILELSVTLLVAIYPVIIVLVLLSLGHKLFKGKREVYIASVSATVVVNLANTVNSIAAKTGIKLPVVGNALTYLPLHEQGLDWVIPAILMAFVGMIWRTGLDGSEISDTKA